MRLFVAIPLNAEMKDRVKTVQDTFRRFYVRGNYTPPENLHITLAFIGEYNDPEAVMEALETVSFSPFQLRMEEMGRFGDLYWTGFGASRDLEALAAGVRRALANAGIPYDRKRFKAHVTILRKPVFADGSKGMHVTYEPGVMTVREFSLMRSDRGKNGMIYTELGNVAVR